MAGFFLLKKEVGEKHVLYKQFNENRDSVLMQTNPDAHTDKAYIEKVVEQKYRTDTAIEVAQDSVSKKLHQILREFLMESSVLFLNQKICHFDRITVYPTIWGVGIQNMKENAVSYPISKNNTDEMIYVVLHELMHTFFFCYLNTNCSVKLEPDSGCDSWNMSEVFNTIVLNSPVFRKFYPKFVPVNYPEHNEILNTIRGQIGNGPLDIAVFLNAYSKILN